MKRNVLLTLLIAVAILAVVEAVFLFGLHEPFLQARDGDPESNEFVVAEGPFSSSRMSTSNASPPGTIPFSNPTGAAGSIDPFAELERMRRQMDEHMRQAMRQVQSGGGGGMVVSIPADLNQEVSPIALEEKDDRYVCTLGIEGVDEDSIEVTVEGTALTISGKKTTESTQEREGRVIAHMRHTEHFSRSTALPGPVKDSCMRTSFKDGVLTVELPKGTQAPESVPLP